MTATIVEIEQRNQTDDPVECTVHQTHPPKCDGLIASWIVVVACACCEKRTRDLPFCEGCKERWIDTGNFTIVPAGTIVEVRPL